MFNKDVNPGDLDMYLSGSSVLYKGRLCKVNRVRDIDNTPTLYLFDLRNESYYTVSYDSPLVEYKVDAVGYVNGPYGTNYVRRYPQRTVKQGLKGCSKSTAKAALRKYPSFDEAWARVQVAGGSIAFHKHFAVTKLGMLKYKGITVGSLKKDKAVLFPDVKFLSVKLKEAMYASK